VFEKFRTLETAGRGTQGMAEVQGFIDGLRCGWLRWAGSYVEAD
jgi:hypothetical protein